MTTVWTFPTKVLFGAGSLTHVSAELVRLRAGHVLVVTDRVVEGLGLLDGVRAALDKANVAYSVFADVEPNPTEQHVEKALAAFKGAHADTILAIGGGSVLDVGKLLRFRISYDAQLSTLRPEALGPIEMRPPPLVAIPTTAGPGAEVTNAALVILREHENKTTFHASVLLPTVSVLDPQLTTSLPPGTTAATGFDALAHAIEAYCAVGDHPMADALALESIELIGLSLERAVHQGHDIEARGLMQKAAMMAGVAAQKGLGAAHALVHPLGSEHGVPHGVAHALCLPIVIDFNRSVVTRKIAKVARILGVRGNDVETLAFECSGAISSIRRACHLPEHLRELNVNLSDLPHLASLASHDPAQLTNPRPCTEADMLTMYKSVM